MDINAPMTRSTKIVGVCVVGNCHSIVRVDWKRFTFSFRSSLRAHACPDCGTTSWYKGSRRLVRYNRRKTVMNKRTRRFHSFPHASSTSSSSHALPDNIFDDLWHSGWKIVAVCEKKEHLCALVLFRFFFKKSLFSDYSHSHLTIMLQSKPCISFGTE